MTLRCREDGGIAQDTRKEEDIRDDGYVHYFDCGDGFTAEDVCQNLYTVNLCSLLYVGKLFAERSSGGERIESQVNFL